MKEKAKKKNSRRERKEAIWAREGIYVCLLLDTKKASICLQAQIFLVS